MAVSVTETCACGASMSATGSWTDTGSRQIAFHRQHRGHGATPAPVVRTSTTIRRPARVRRVAGR